MMDGTDRLCNELYEREAKETDWLGGCEAKMLHDAATTIELLRVENKHLREVDAKVSSTFLDLEKERNKLKAENERLKKALGAFYDFCECEMGWQYFRAEYELTDSPNATLSNAKKLKAFLEEMRATRKDMEGEG